MALAIASVVFYQMGQKLVPSNASPFVVFATAYGTAGLLCLAAIALSPRPITAAEFRASISWPTWLIALTIFGIEMGFLLVYRSGWKVSIAYAVSSIITIIVLAAIGTTVFGETLGLRRIAGIGMACASLWLLVSGGTKA
jgi:multidrug transporter EmrE-like cation transporter